MTLFLHYFWRANIYLFFYTADHIRLFIALGPNPISNIDRTHTGSVLDALSPCTALVETPLTVETEMEIECDFNVTGRYAYLFSTKEAAQFVLYELELHGNIILLLEFRSIL